MTERVKGRAEARSPARHGKFKAVPSYWPGDRKRDKAFSLWLSCETQENIAETVGIDRTSVSRWEEEFVQKLATDNFTNWTDFTPPIYNVWKQQVKAFGLWLACETQESIAETVEVTQQTIANWESEFTKKLVADNLVNWTDFTPPIYNVWKQQVKAFGLWLACETQENIAETVGVPLGTIPGWEKEFLEKLVTDNSRNWTDFTPPRLSCHTQEEIAEECGIDQRRVSELLPDSENFPIPVKYLFQDDFEPPIYNATASLGQAAWMCRGCLRSGMMPF